MRGIQIAALIVLLAGLVTPGIVAAQDAGRIEGQITREADGQTVAAVTVVLTETGQVALTDDDGAFSFGGVAAGTYTLSISLGSNADTRSVTVEAGATAAADLTVDWDVSFADTITVVSASRRRERVVDAPASVTAFAEEEISREASSGQLAKVVAFAPGVEVTQSGLTDFNLNARGFNSSLNRRVQTLIDGREPSVPFLGSTDWSAITNLEDMASVELVRGPSSALYGANAFNGVLNIITKGPRDSVGGRATFGGGEQSTLRADAFTSVDLGSDWYLKASASYLEAEDFVQSRVDSVEYPGLPREVVAPDDEFESLSGTLRLDKHVGDTLYTLEGGYFESESGTAVTGIGRVNIGDVERPYARFNISHPRFNVLGFYNSREAPDQTTLSTGRPIFLDTENYKFEIQGNQDWNGGKIRLVGGASYKEEDIDTADFDGRQTLVFAPVTHDYTGVFGQLDLQLTDTLKLVIAGRWDDSSLHDSQVSPKAALVWNITGSQTLRFSYNEAFQVANYSEFFLDAPTALVLGPGAPPIFEVDLAAIEAGLCAPFGVDCGFGTPTQVRALGNVDLELEEIESFEIGYTGILANKVYLTIDVYRNELTNFITDLTANPFGAINPNFGAYAPPPNHPAPDLLVGNLAGALGPLFPFLSNNVDGTPIFALASYTNAGAVDTEGVDLGLNFYATPRWLFEFTYSFFDFEIQEASVAGDSLLPNAPEHKLSAGVSYTAPTYSLALKARWVDDFLWAAGVFAGPVESYTDVSLSANYQVNETISLGLNVSNLFDDDHYQSFGGDILARRAIGSVTLRW
ncbi:MAG: TonB-dependent receptor [Acidobacteriota bacterium]